MCVCGYTCMWQRDIDFHLHSAEKVSEFRASNPFLWERFYLDFLHHFAFFIFQDMNFTGYRTFLFPKYLKEKKNTFSYELEKSIPV